jgi:hypothetical protein
MSCLYIQVNTSVTYVHLSVHKDWTGPETVHHTRMSTYAE